MYISNIICIYIYIYIWAIFVSLYGCVHDNSEKFIAFGQLIRSRYGPKVLPIWSQNDLNMVPIWFQYDPNVLQEWPQVGPPGVISSAPTFIMVIGHRISFRQEKITFFKKSNFGRTYVYNDYWLSDFICVSKHQVLKKKVFRPHLCLYRLSSIGFHLR